MNIFKLSDLSEYRVQEHEQPSAGNHRTAVLQQYNSDWYYSAIHTLCVPVVQVTAYRYNRVRNIERDVLSIKIVPVECQSSAHRDISTLNLQRTIPYLNILAVSLMFSFG